jgi:hypothetical protein
MLYASRRDDVHRRRAILPVALTVSLALATWCGCGRPEPARDAAAPPDVATLCDRIDVALAHARDARRLDATVHGGWQVVHGILAFGPDLRLEHPDGESPALDYLLEGGRLTGWILRPGSHGVVAVVEPGSTMGQGHPDQWLGYLSQCGVTAGGRPAGIPLDTPLQLAGRGRDEAGQATGGDVPFTVGDLLAQAKHDIRPGQEATWTLMALAAWEPEAAWAAGDGSRWSVERVAAMEADADIISAACGGAHRLYGLATALEARRRAGHDPAAERTDSGWAAARATLEEYLERARLFQQADGSFSTHSFERPGTSPDVFARLSATGHVFEVLALALADERLGEPWVVRAADRLTTLLEQTADLDVECGALYHAAHGLAIYRGRVCGR